MLRIRRTLLLALGLGAGLSLMAGCEPDPEECWVSNGTLAQVTSDTLAVNHLMPAISPDGTRVLFVSDAFVDDDGDDQDGIVFDFVLMDLPVPGEFRGPVPNVLDAGNGRRVVLGSIDDEVGALPDANLLNQSFPAWHPDGVRFAGTITRNDFVSRLFIFTLDFGSQITGSIPIDDAVLVDDVNLAQDVQLLKFYYYESPVFSPDGNWLLYARHFYRAANPPVEELIDEQAIYAINVPDLVAGTRTVIQVTPKGSLVTHPTFNAAGNRIAFESNRDGGQREIYTIAFDPTSPTPVGNPVRLTHTERDPGDPIPVQSWQPTWLSSGRIAFTSTRRPPCTSLRERNIWVMNADGSDQQLAFRTRVDDHSPAFDPSGGSTIAFSTRSNPIEAFDDAKTDIWILRGF